MEACKFDPFDGFESSFQCRKHHQTTTKNGKRTLTSYWRLPDRLYDDADELAQWARQALAER
jgi:TfoX/Sxy family transcriptional regulator of competence genes